MCNNDIRTITEPYPFWCSRFVSDLDHYNQPKSLREQLDDDQVSLQLMTGHHIAPMLAYKQCCIQI